MSNERECISISLLIAHHSLLPRRGACVIQYIIRRLIQAVFVVLGVITVVFFVVRLTGDPVRLLLSATSSEADIQNVRHNLKLDRPIWEQYVTFVSNAVHGNFGTSIHYQGFDAMHLVTQSLPAHDPAGGLRARALGDALDHFRGDRRRQTVLGAR